MLLQEDNNIKRKFHSFIVNSIHPHWPLQGAPKNPPPANNAATDRRCRGATADPIAAGGPPQVIMERAQEGMMERLRLDNAAYFIYTGQEDVPMDVISV